MEQLGDLDTNPRSLSIMMISFFKYYQEVIVNKFLNIIKKKDILKNRLKKRGESDQHEKTSLA